MKTISFTIFLIMTFFFLLIISVQFLLGIFVYRDAKARGMDPLLWTLLAVFAPGFIGLIIYLIIRRDHVKMSCPKCGGEVNQTFVSCPNCGQKLCASCVNCGFALRPEWKLCPHCGAEIAEVGSFIPPVLDRPNNKGVGVAIAAILAVPLATILIIACIGFGAYFLSTDNGDEQTDLTELSMSDHYQFALGSFQNASDYQKLSVAPADDGVLTKTELDWIKEKKKGENGIYSMTFLRNEGDYLNSNWGKGAYTEVVAVTVVVINTPDGKKYEPVHYESNDSGYPMESEEYDQYEDEMSIADHIVILLRQQKNTEENDIDYDNAFVIIHPVQYNVEFDFSDDNFHQSITCSMSEDELTLILSEKDEGFNGDQYVIPYKDDQDYYTPFN